MGEIAILLFDFKQLDDSALILVSGKGGAASSPQRGHAPGDVDPRLGIHGRQMFVARGRVGGPRTGASARDSIQHRP